MRGFVQQPTEIAIKKGYYRPSRHGEISKEKEKLGFLNSVPNAPERLNQHGARYWTEILTELIKIKGLVCIPDLPAYELMAWNYQVIIECREDLDKNGLMVVDNHGNIKQSPFWITLKEAEKIFLNISREFGCTPSARNNINFKSLEEKKDPLLEFEI